MRNDPRVVTKIGKWKPGEHEHHWLVAEYPEGPPHDYLLLG